MHRNMPVVHPVRIAAVLLLAGAISLASYQILRPETFSYVKVRDGVTVEAGQTLQWEQLEEGVLTIGGLFVDHSGLPPGLIPWSEAEQYLELALNRRVHGASPLLISDFIPAGGDELDLVADESMTGLSIPVDNVIGVTPQLAVGDRVHVYASFEDEQGAHTGLLLQDMPVMVVQREWDGAVTELAAVTIALTQEEAVLLTHALHYGKIRLGKAFVREQARPGIGDRTFAAALIRTQKRWDRTGGDGE
ncbi:RcpC/CpaB family pilus assembly protein [Brevibacillus humidisoli]|uniref:RcpC/CpaB family pilus assembly protein n=1 Tax=Brevibacillus humidisoli TaxID=2895522 RepID=UPI001E52D7FC|nr:RcpC/CpaB family pilus assembly protein [Brevibacillus humidisoli]UFJ40576.1 RcpC/CpaB family pilus assembly protein [Brevibacillus humidisoli]